jgi:hypothetical protein
MQTRAFRARSYFNLSPSSLPVVARKLFPRCPRLKEISIAANFLGNFAKIYTAEHFAGLSKTLQVLDIDGAHVDLPKLINNLPNLPMLKRLSFNTMGDLVGQLLGKVSAKLTHLSIQIQYPPVTTHSILDLLPTMCPALENLRLGFSNPALISYRPRTHVHSSNVLSLRISNVRVPPAISERRGAPSNVCSAPQAPSPERNLPHSRRYFRRYKAIFGA